MKMYAAFAKRLLSALLVLAALISGISPCARASAETEPEASYESDVPSLHVGDTHQWKPFVDYPQLQVAYESSDPDVLSIASDGTMTALREGEAMVTATTAKTGGFSPAEYECLIVVFSSGDGLYLSEMCSYFYYRGAKYASGELPLEVERDLERHIPAERRAIAHHWLILHGRYTCTARNPKCADCGLAEWCRDYLSR